VFANEAARRMSAGDDGLALDRGGRPYAADRAANQRQRDVASGGSGGLVRVPRPHGEPAYVVIVAPLFRGEGLDGGRRTAPHAARGRAVQDTARLSHLACCPGRGGGAQRLCRASRHLDEHRAFPPQDGLRAHRRETPKRARATDHRGAQGSRRSPWSKWLGRCGLAIGAPAGLRPRSSPPRTGSPT